MKDEKNVKITDEAHKALKLYCVENDMDLKTGATKMVFEYLELKKQEEEKKGKENI